MQEGFRIAVNWKSRKSIPDLPVEEILDKVSDTILDMAIENGKMARTLHEVLLKIFNTDTVPSAVDIAYLRNVIIENLGNKYADSFTEEEHKN